MHSLYLEYFKDGSFRVVLKAKKVKKEGCFEMSIDDLEELGYFVFMHEQEQKQKAKSKEVHNEFETDSDGAQTTYTDN